MTEKIISWKPGQKDILCTHIFKWMKELKIENYLDFHAWSVRNRGDFWFKAIKKLGIKFDKPFSNILDLTLGVTNPVWLKDAKLNIAKSCFNAPPESRAILYSDQDGEIKSMSYGQLDKLSNKVANGLIELGLKKGDRVAINMPMSKESVGIYLGIIKCGMSVVSIADSFAPKEIKTRLRVAQAKAIFTQDIILRANKILPLYEKVKDSDSPKAIILAAKNKINVKLRSVDLSWSDFLSSKDHYDAVSCDPEDATNILFSSGTTGEPKAIPWTHLTPIKCATDAHLHHDIHPGEVICWPSNLGWMMGPWLIFASLINRGTMALYHDVPINKNFGTFVQNTEVNILGLVPSMVKAWRLSKCMEGLNWTTIKAFSSTGETSNAEDYSYLMSLAKNRPVIEYCGGTEIGGGFLTQTLLQPAIPGTFSTPALGLDFVILDDQGKTSNSGELFLMPPSIGLSSSLLSENHDKVYYKNVPKGPKGEILRRHGDQMQRLKDGYYRALGRADDTMNLSGIKVGCAEIESVLIDIEDVIETAAIAIQSKEGGPSQLVIYCVMDNSHKQPNELKNLMQEAIKLKLNPLLKIEDVVVIDRLPRTASNKVMRRKLRDNY